MQRIVLTFGLIGGALLAAMMLATLPFIDRIGFDRGAVVGYTTMVLAFLMVYVGVRSYRDTVAGGTVSFGRAFTVGLLISVIIAACYVVTWEVMFHTFMPDFVDRYAAFTIEKARAAGATEAQLAVKTRELSEFATMYQNPLLNVAFTFLEPLPVGLVYTVITAAVLGRKRTAARAAA